TFHLFARDLLDHLFKQPTADAGAGAELDLVGDIHSENYGTFKADDGHVHYDVNDFDETTRGRLDFDARRQATSLLLACQERGDGLADAVAVVLAFLDTYADTVRRLLKKGKDLDLDFSDGAHAPYKALDAFVRSAAATKRSAFVNKLTTWEGDGRRLV